MSALRIDAIRVRDRHRTDLGDLTDLAESIASIGLLHPIVITSFHRLVAGQRRLEACRKLGWTEVPVRVADDLGSAAGLLAAERDENTCRKPMTASELYALGKALERLERPQAKGRQGQRHDLGGTSGPVGPEVPRGTNPTATAVGQGIGMSPMQWKRLKHIGDRAAEGDDQAAATLEAIDRGERTVSGGYLDLRDPARQGKARLRAEVRSEQIAALAAKGYRATQIAAEIGVSEDQVRRLARAHDIELPDAAIGKTRRPDTNRIIDETVGALAGTAIALRLIEEPRIDRSQAAEWATSLKDSLTPIKKLVKTLEKVAHE